MRESDLRAMDGQELSDYLDEVLDDTRLQEDLADNSPDPLKRLIAGKEAKIRPVIIREILDEMRRRQGL